MQRSFPSALLWVNKSDYIFTIFISLYTFVNYQSILMLSIYIFSCRKLFVSSADQPGQASPHCSVISERSGEVAHLLGDRIDIISFRMGRLKSRFNATQLAIHIPINSAHSCLSSIYYIQTFMIVRKYFYMLRSL